MLRLGLWGVIRLKLKKVLPYFEENSMVTWLCDPNVSDWNSSSTQFFDQMVV